MATVNNPWENARKLKLRRCPADSNISYDVEPDINYFVLQLERLEARIHSFCNNYTDLFGWFIVFELPNNIAVQIASINLAEHKMWRLYSIELTETINVYRMTLSSCVISNYTMGTRELVLEDIAKLWDQRFGALFPIRETDNYRLEGDDRAAKRA